MSEAMIRFQEQEQARRRQEAEQSTLTRVRPIPHSLSSDAGLSNFLRQNTIRVQVPNPNNEPRCKVFINSANWQNEFYQKQSQLKPNTLILVSPYDTYGYYMMKVDYNTSELNLMPIKIILSDSHYENQAMLDEKARSIDLNRLGHLGIVKPRYISSQLFGTFIKYGASQCIIDNVSNTEHGICVRDFIPNEDFLDGNGDRIQSFEWTQPANIQWDAGHVDNNGHRVADGHHGYQTGGGTDFITLYTTTNMCNNDRKIYFLCGIKNLKFAGIPRKKDEIHGVQAAVGGPAEVFLTQLRICFGNVKLAELADMSLLNEYGTIFFQRPIMFKRADNMRILANVKQSGIRKVDNLKPLGFIVEAHGAIVHG
jgi:hypothetical protein